MIKASRHHRWARRDRSFGLAEPTNWRAGCGDLQVRFGGRGSSSVSRSHHDDFGDWDEPYATSVVTERRDGEVYTPTPMHCKQRSRRMFEGSVHHIMAKLSRNSGKPVKC